MQCTGGHRWVHSLVMTSALLIMPAVTTPPTHSLANINSRSYASLGWAYPAPAAVQDVHTILAGTWDFSPDEVEVFYLDPTQ